MNQEHKCVKCDKPATTRITKITNYNKMHELLLCDEHAQEYHPYLRKTPPIMELIQQLVKQGPAAAQPGADPESNPTCSNCNLEFDAYRKTLLLGCSDCYTSFEKLLIPDLRKIHGAVHHDPLYEVATEQAGAVVEKPKPETTLSVKAEPSVDDLRKLLEAAIFQEHFEEAARLRDKIKLLEIVEIVEIVENDTTETPDP